VNVIEEEFEENKGEIIIRSVYGRKTDNTMAINKNAKG
jgi:hypothetical protein